MKIFTQQERVIVLILSGFLILGIFISFLKENFFKDSSDNLKLIGVSEEINSIYDSNINISENNNQELTIVNINTADEIELVLLPGIGPALANRIIEERKNSGTFESPKDLKRVKGIGIKTLEKLLPFIKI